MIVVAVTMLMMFSMWITMRFTMKIAVMIAMVITTANDDDIDVEKN